MKHRFSEWFSIQLAKRPGRLVLSAILLFNIIFILLSATVISSFKLEGTEKMGFLEAAYCTVSMILDAGCISMVVQDIGQGGVAIAIVCIAIVLIGMISFTGAVIGYITNGISSFIENANSRNNKIRLWNHTVILNWNTRASEILNDMLYLKARTAVVVLVATNKQEIENEINERLSGTIERENKELKEQCKKLGFVQGKLLYMRERFYNNVTVIVKEGDVFSSRQLTDVSLEQAKTVIILGNDVNNTVCKYEHLERIEEVGHGNPHTVKTLMQVADITAAEYSLDAQKIIVEVEDDWTWDAVAKIIKCKEVDKKCNIIPVRVNKILGQILSQFSLMPELNLAYRELFSNKGATFYTEPYPNETDPDFIANYLDKHRHSIPLTIMNSSKGKPHAYYSTTSQKNIGKESTVHKSDYTVKLKSDYWLDKKNIIMLGHNSKCTDIMQGFNAFIAEWQYQSGNDSILNIVIIDDKKHLEKMNHYKDYSFVVETIAANIYDKELVCSAIERIVSANKGDTSILILSDDEAPNEDIDANALANLIYVQDIINRKKAASPDFDIESIDLVVEIIDPKHHDIVSSYSVNNVVISNRYISKMLTQIGAKEALFDFYRDILTYDTGNSKVYDSKEIYTKNVSAFFTELPAPCTAEEFIRAVYKASIDQSLPKEKRNPTIVLGYVKPGGKMILFDGDQADIKVELSSKDKLIVFSSH